MEELVTCLICGHQAVTLARHLKASHGVTADVYRSQYSGARIRSETCEANRKSSILKSHKDKPRTGLKKTITCPSCGTRVEVGLTFAHSVHDARCLKCRSLEEEKEANEKWASKLEGSDYVVCVKCGLRAENLTSHVQSVHLELVGCYPGQILATNSKVRDKTALKGRKLSEEVKAKMSASAGWNRGLTKDTDARVAKAAAAMKGRTPWNEGLTKEDHPSLQSTSTKLSQLRGPDRYWSNGLKADLSRVDFTPYIDETGAVDRKSMSESLGVSEVTITKYMESIGLRISTKYVDARVERDTQKGRFFEMSRKSVEQTTIRLTAEQLDPYKLKNGKVMLGRAMIGLGHVYGVIKRECDRLGIPTHTWLVRQSICLEAVAKALGGVEYESEWRSRKFMSSRGGFFRFDGYFPSHDLVVEFHGYQHYVFPSVYIQKEELFFALQERDRIKENLIHSDPTIRYFLVREDEPYADPEYLRGRLIDEGILDPGK
jgi:hypothetical protein